MTTALGGPDAPVGARRVLRSPAMLGPLSQGITSVSNVVMMLAVASALAPGEFGVFALVQSLALVVEGLVRAGLGETMAVVGASSSHAHRQGIVSVAATVGFAAAVSGVVVSATFLHGRTASLAIAVAVGIVPRVVADAERLLAFALHDPATAVVIDSVWFGAQLILMVTAIVVGMARPEAAVWAWGIGAGVAAVVGARTLRVVPAFGAGRDGWSWLAEHRVLAKAYAGEFLMVSASTQAVLWPVALVSTTEAVASLRGAQLIFGPVATLVLGLRNALTPQAGALLARDDERGLARLVIGASVGAAAVALVNVVVFAAIPDAFGAELLGGSWPLVAAIVLPYGLSRVVFSGYVGPLIVLRVRTLTATGVRLRTVSALLGVLAMVGGVAIGGAALASWLLLAAAAITFVLYCAAAAPTFRSAGRLLPEGVH